MQIDVWYGATVAQAAARRPVNIPAEESDCWVNNAGSIFNIQYIHSASSKSHPIDPVVLVKTFSLCDEIFCNARNIERSVD